LKTRKNDDDIPPGLMIILELIGSHFGFPPMSDAKIWQDHDQYHQGMIQRWESMRSELTKRFGAQVATDMIELQKMSWRFCENSQPGAAMLVSLVADLVLAADGDMQVTQAATSMLRDLTARTMAVTEHKHKVQAQAKAEAAEMAKKAKKFIKDAKAKRDAKEKAADQAANQAAAARAKAKAEAELN
jgi:hypothetical protein